MIAACHVVVARDRSAPVVLTCEHASARLPEPWAWPVGDAWLTHTHWAVDLGAEDLTRELADEMGAGAAICGFSRLLIDPNRPLGSPELIRRTAEGRAVALNAAVDAAERRRRIAWWQAYHHGAESVARDSEAPFLFAVHSFTPVYEGQQRELVIGVLFDHEQGAAERLARSLEGLGPVELNAPYSGKDGLIYSAQRHADASGKRPLEIEVRQDLAVDPSFRSELVRRLCDHHWT